ncbi:hypothetical protein F183_A15300 [Bryobacterales bacterium F-183]|nr:hypothetical protein F183_A15300 [Bryobacterales bacterium F-183]
MLIRTIAYCGLATSACWAGIANPGVSSQLTSTERSVPTLDQVSRLQTPSYMTGGRIYDSYVLYLNVASSSGPAADSFSAPQIQAANATFGSGPVDTTSFFTYDGGESPTQFVNLLANSTTVGSESTTSGSDAFGFSSYSVTPTISSTEILSDGPVPGATLGDGSSTTNDTTAPTTYNTASLGGRFASPQVITLAAEPVPEPSTGIAAGLASSVLLWLRHRSRSAKK